VLRNGGRLYEESDLHDVITACMIMHNMIIRFAEDGVANMQPVVDVVKEDVTLAMVVSRYNAMTHRPSHDLLVADLVEHVYHFRGENE
jgi:hypothetical protein